MEYRKLEITVISANDLNRANLISPTKAYAVVSISRDPSANQQQTTPVDRDGHRSPTWNFLANFTVSESLARSNRLSVKFSVRCQGLSGDKDIGEVDVPLSRLIGIEDGEVHSQTCQLVQNPSQNLAGELNFSYKWGEKIVTATAPPDEVPGYPSPPQSCGGARAQPPQHPSKTALRWVASTALKLVASTALGVGENVISDEISSK